jgi:hypothetical protein
MISVYKLFINAGSKMSFTKFLQAGGDAVTIEKNKLPTWELVLLCHRVVGGGNTLFVFS